MEVLPFAAYGHQRLTMSDPEFEALLDRMEQEMESEEEDDSPVEAHRWESERAAELSCDDYRFQCSKCAAKLTVRQDQSMADALEEQGVLPNCAEQLVKEVGAF